MWIVRDILRDGAKHVAANSKPQKDNIGANSLEARNAAAETAQRKALS